LPNQTRKPQMVKQCNLDQQKKFTATIIGILIGAGGLNEWSVIGMAAWTAIFFSQCWAKLTSKILWQDIIIVAISILCILQWAYNDPILSSDNTGITIQEIIKISIWLIYGISMVRSPKIIFFKTLNGVAYGIGIFALTTTIGAFLTQPFQGSRGLIFNIFTGQIDAGSTFISYSCVASALLLVITNNKLAWLGSLTCISLGIQADNRHSLLAGAIIIIYLILKCFSEYFRRDLETNNKGVTIKQTILVAILLIIALGFYLLSKQLSFDALERFAQFGGRDARYTMYSTGYLLLGKSITTNSFEIMEDVNQQVVGWSPGWWHSLPLDSARSSGWLGLICSVIWIAGILKGMLNASINKGKYILVGSLSLLTLLTSIPVGLGSYELLGSLALTQAMISSDKA
jgi:hypothetical protein